MSEYWFIACASSRLISGAPVRCRILESEIHLWRDASGRACVREPGTGCVENLGYVWVRLAGAAEFNGPALEGFENLSWMQGSHEFRSEFWRVLEITADLSHIPFGHQGHPYQLWNDLNGTAPARLDATISVDGVHGHVEQEIAGGLSFDIRFHAPSTIIFQVPRGRLCAILFFHVVPTQDSKVSRLEWMISDVTALNSGVSWVEEASVIEEDRYLLDLTQGCYNREGEAFERHVEADAFPLLVRRIARAAATGHWPADLTRLPRRMSICQQLPRPGTPTTSSVDRHLSNLGRLMEPEI